MRDGQVVAAFRLAHGDEPEAALRRLGWAVLRPVEAVSALRRASQVATGPGRRPRLSCDDVRTVVVRLEVKPCTPEQSVPPGAGRDPDVVVPDGASLPRFQRVGAYALVRSRRGLLATRHSGRTNRPGTWGLPGGGVEPGEDPRAAAVRECWEETAQRVDLGSLALVQTAHWIGRAPSGRVEDFHAVRLVYHGQCPAPTSPDVLDAEGTTAAAAWVPSDQVGQVRWAAPAREQLMRLGLLPAS